jgi:F-type H+-transporting ATPase subunit b
MANSAPNSASEATTAEVGHESGGHANFPPFDSSTFPSQIAWLAITFGALYYFMSKRFLPKVGQVIETRRQRIAKDLDEATELQQKAAAAGAAHEQALADARAKAQSLAQATRDQLSAEADAKRKALEGELAAKLSTAEAQIAKTRSEAMSNVAGIAEGAAGAIVERLIGRSVDQQIVANAVSAAKSN